jgi:hypothetical protein
LHGHKLRMVHAGRQCGDNARARVDDADEVVGNVGDKDGGAADGDAVQRPKCGSGANAVGRARRRAASTASQRCNGVREKGNGSDEVVAAVSDIDGAAGRVNGNAVGKRKQRCRAHAVAVASRGAKGDAAASDYLHGPPCGNLADNMVLSVAYNYQVLVDVNAKRKRKLDIACGDGAVVERAVGCKRTRG